MVQGLGMFRVTVRNVILSSGFTTEWWTMGLGYEVYMDANNEIDYLSDI